MRFPLLIARAIIIAGGVIALPAFAQAAAGQADQADRTDQAPATGNASHDATNRNSVKPNDVQAQNQAPNPNLNGSSVANGHDGSGSYAENNIPADRENGANVNGEPPSSAAADSPNH